MVISLENLTEEEHIVKVINGEAWDFQQVDLIVPYQGAIDAIKGIYEQLGLPYIIDDFKDPIKRREWKKQLPLETLKVVEENGLRRGMVSSLILYAMNIRGNYEHSSEVTKMANSINIDGKFLQRSYDKLPISEKIKFVKDIKLKIYNLIGAVIKYEEDQVKKTIRQCEAKNTIDNLSKPLINSK